MQNLCWNKIEKSVQVVCIAVPLDGSEDQFWINK